ncbi:MAG: VWA domain-containing protein [Selenomonadaceae bacterium]|nr:VWA domain-containing protein [Selenomonadaceae bacterium]
MGMLDKVEIPRKMCPVIFLLDTSGSMSGAPIGAVNDAIRNVLPELISMNESNADNEIKIAVITFDYDAKWIIGENELMSPEDVQNVWRDLDANGYTSMGAAFRALNEKLSVSNGFMKRASGSVAPVLFLLSDGEPTDDYRAGLQVLQKNNWYKIAVRVAVGYGDANDGILREFTGNEGTVLHTNDTNELKNTIRFVAVTSSRVASQGSSVSPDDNNANPDDNTGTVANALKNQGALGNANPDEEW